MMTNAAGPPPPLPLAVTDAARRFGDVAALAGVSFTAARGELVGLLGPNGAGKTTLIRAIAGRLRLDRGVVHLMGRMLSPADPRPELGVVPQELAVYPLLTPRENLEVFGRLAGVSKNTLAAEVASALEWADLADRKDAPVKTLSGGMKRRLNIACSLLHRPSVVLLDEPTVGVDPQSRERIYEMLGSLRARGVAIVLTTHHLEEAEERCDRIVIIDHGTIIADGTVRELTSRTVTGARELTLTLKAPWPAGEAPPAGMTVDADGHALHVPVADIGADVAAALGLVSGAGHAIAGIDISGATLQDVFIALTGRELRE